jgi:hypothetical protein
LRRTKPRFEYIGFVQPVLEPKKNINKIKELNDFPAIEGFIQVCNLLMATKRHGYCIHHYADRCEPCAVALNQHLSSIPSLPAPKRVRQCGYLID